MTIELDKKEKVKKSFAPKIVWAIFIFLIIGIIFIGFGFFTSLTKNQKDKYTNAISILEKKGIKLVNILPQGEVLGINKKNNEEKYKNYLTMFRGTPKRDWYGSGNIPEDMEIKWRYPDEPMCGESEDRGEIKKWCGTGWTGQPVVYKNQNKTEIIFGAYDKKVHFIDPNTGKKVREPFETEDIIKGTVTVDPDGFPLIYFGSRDNKLRIVSLEEDGQTKELWQLDAKELPGIWNDDWDANPVILEDILYTGGENGWFFAIKLNREMDGTKVSVKPEIIFSLASYDKEFLDKVKDNNVSIENSVAIHKDIAYFGNSGGRILGVKIKENPGEIVFDYWTGDDVDASIVIDDEGNLYVGVEEERLNERSKEVGQFLKLNPSKENPLEWSIAIKSDKENIKGGVWATPAIHEDYIYVPTNPGDLLVIDKNSGEVKNKYYIGVHAWSSPIISNEKLLLATCEGKILVFDIKDGQNILKINEFAVPGGSCIESTPALLDGEIFVGSRDGFFYKIAEKSN